MTGMETGAATGAGAPTTRKAGSSAGVGAAALALAAAFALAAPAAAQWSVAADDHDWCDRSWGDDERVCEVRVATFDAPGALEVDGGDNGGIRVEGWDRPEMRVEARVWARSRDDLDRALDLAGAVTLEMDGGRLLARGPDAGRRESWGVSWRVWMPRESDLDLETHNGGISVHGIHGRVAFDALNGGVRLEEVGGDVRGRTTNGGLRVVLAGDRWEGRGLDVETTNGGVDVRVPDGYSARLVTGTTNGGMEIDFPVTVRGRIGRRLETQLGDGGPTVRAITTNGGVRIRRSG